MIEVLSNSQGKIDSIHSTIIPREKLEGEHGRLASRDNRANSRWSDDYIGDLFPMWVFTLFTQPLGIGVVRDKSENM